MDQRKRVTTRSALSIGAVGILAAVALISMVPAFACTVQAHIETRPRRVDPGAVIRVDGAGFEANGGPVNVYWGGDSGITLASATQVGGVFSVDVRVPANAMAGQEYLVSGVQTNTAEPYRADTVVRTSRPAEPPETVPNLPATTPTVAPSRGSAQPQTIARAASSPAPAQSAKAHPQAAADPSSPPEDASGFSRSGVSPFGQPGQVAPLVIRQRNAFGGTVSPAAGRSPWLLLPLGVIGLTLFAGAGAAVVRQARSQGIRATA